jgi:TPR repeat protein
MTQIKPILIALFMAFALLVTAIVPVANAQGFKTAEIANASYQSGTKSSSYEPSIAVTVWRDAAKRGDSSAQFMLGLYNAKGQDMPQNLIKAYVWFKLSASNYPLSKILLKHVEGQLTKDKIAMGNILVQEWQNQQ